MSLLKNNTKTETENKNHILHSKDFIEQKTKFNNIETPTFINKVEKLIDFSNIIKQSINKYKLCRNDTNVPMPKTHCIASSVSSLIVEKSAKTIGKGLIIKGGSLISAGLIPEPVAPLLISAGTAEIAGGSYLVMKAEKMGDAVFNEMNKNYKNLYKQVNPPKEIVAVSVNNEYLKLNMETKSITKIEKAEALDIMLLYHKSSIESIHQGFKNNIKDLQVSKFNLDTTKQKLNFKVNHKVITNIDEPLQKHQESKQVLDLSYETINNYILDSKNTYSKIDEITSKHVSYSPPIAMSDTKWVPTVSGNGGSSGEFIILFPILTIPLSGGCNIL